MRRLLFVFAIFVSFSASFVSFSASAAAFSNAQLLTLRSAALADGTAAVYVFSANDQALADWFNQTQATFWVWRSSFTPRMARSAIVQGATQLDALTAGKRDSLLWLFSDSIDPSDASTRSAIDDLTGSQNTLKASLQAAIKRQATRAEKLLSTGTGSNADPAKIVYEGFLSAAEASSVRVAE